MKAIDKAKAFYRRHENKIIVATGATMITMSQAHAALDMKDGTDQLTLGLAAVGALGASKLAPAALSWVWSLVTRVAQR